MQTQPVRAGGRLLTAAEVRARAGIKKTLFYKLIKTGRFPPGIYVTPDCPRWPESVIDAWISEKMQTPAS